MSTLSFNTIIENITHTSNVGYYMIHLEHAVERVDTIKKLENDLNTSIPIFIAANGYQLTKDGHPTRCQQRGDPFTRSSGEVGCTVSHINICKEALEKGYEYIVIFEDDCEFRSSLASFQDSMNQFNNLHLPFDLFTLGHTPLSTSNINGTIFSKINRFDCTHACILNQNFMKKLVETYEEYYNNNTVLSVDTMYSNVIEKYNMNAYGVTNHLTYFVQKYGLYSYVFEGFRR